VSCSILLDINSKLIEHRSKMNVRTRLKVVWRSAWNSFCCCRSFAFFIFDLMSFVCIFCIRFDYFVFQHFCEKILWELKYCSASRFDVIVRSSRLITILNKLILKELNHLLIQSSNESDVFFLCFCCYELCQRKTREFCYRSTHHLLQSFSMYKKIFISVEFLIEMSSSFAFSSNELNNMLIDNVSSLSSTFLSRDDQHNKLMLFSESNASLQEIFREWWNSISYELKNLTMTKTRKEERRKMFWDNSFRTNESWNNYIETALLIDDTFRLLYRRCDLNMIHSTSINSKNNSLRNHWINKTCSKLVIQKYSNVNIEIALQKIFHKSFFTDFFNRRICRNQRSLRHDFYSRSSARTIFKNSWWTQCSQSICFFARWNILNLYVLSTCFDQTHTFRNELCWKILCEKSIILFDRRFYKIWNRIQKSILR
jgi:hypothetical protein